MRYAKLSKKLKNSQKSLLIFFEVTHGKLKAGLFKKTASSLREKAGAPVGTDNETSFKLFPLQAKRACSKTKSSSVVAITASPSILAFKRSR